MRLVKYFFIQALKRPRHLKTDKKVIYPRRIKQAKKQEERQIKAHILLSSFHFSMSQPLAPYTIHSWYSLKWLETNKNHPILCVYTSSNTSRQKDRNPKKTIDF